MAERDSSYDKATLIFLDTIEKNQTRMIEALEAFPQTVPAGLNDAFKTISAAMGEVAKAVDSLPKDKAINLSLNGLTDVITSMLAISNTVTMSINKVVNEMSQQTNKIVASNNALLAALKKPKKWKMTPDRNYNTKLIQEVTIEQIGE